MPSAPRHAALSQRPVGARCVRVQMRHSSTPRPVFLSRSDAAAMSDDLVDAATRKSFPRRKA